MNETIFTYGAPGLKFGPGSSAEIGYELRSRGVGRVLVVTDPGVRATGHPDTIADRLRDDGLEVSVYADVRVEPTDESILDAVSEAKQAGPFDAVVAVGGGSSIDTAKAVNLLTTNDGELTDYLNPPIGAGNGNAGPEIRAGVVGEG